ncbi:hypothetical protein [Liquorilactobacillus hordei]|uniref:Uncharacterized protein n=1 Tax=Liquorilactobacillus hordei TaxID=468911 RepID=A0A3Q8CYG3_9LACO|nr:hypothetical protein [Liquorilactobacillus hordei]AUJ29619.1 hypothetical protein BSQ49_05035 [Liquorilactobacillus hordei]
MTFLGIEVGSWADWFSGIITTMGIIFSVSLSLNKDKFKFDINTRGNGYDLFYSIINHSGFDVKAQMIRLSFRTNKCKRSEFNTFIEHKAQNYVILKNNELRQNTFQLINLIEEENTVRQYYNGKIPFDMQRLNFDTKKFKNHKRFYVIVEILAQDGKFYHSKPKRFRLEDIMCMKKINN